MTELTNQNDRDERRNRRSGGRNRLRDERRDATIPVESVRERRRDREPSRRDRDVHRRDRGATDPVAAESTRRAFVARVGALGLAGLGIASGGATAGDDRRGEYPTSDDPTPDDQPFADPIDLEAFVDDVMAERIGDDAPGASVAVVDGDDLVLAKGYGHADVESETPVSATETAFEIGSVGKLVTWTAVMQGVEDGTLALDEDVNAYLDDSGVRVPDTYEDPVTLDHLGTHTAGFESAIDPAIVDDPDRLTSLETVLVENLPDRVRPPGEAVGYSNYGAALAGHVVAETAGTSFEEHVRSEIFDPLGMTHSTFAQPVPADRPGTLAAPHERTGEEFVTVDPVYVNMWPAGSMTATAADVAAFASAHLGGGAVGDARILGADAVDAMHDRRYERHPAVTNWRYGFYEYGPPDAGLIGHSGATIHHESQLVLAPERRVGVFVTFNARPEESSPADVVDELLEEYDLLPDPETPVRTDEPGGRSRAEAVAGEYRPTMLPESGPLHVLDVLSRVSVEAIDDGRLRTETLDGDDREWIETEPYVYRAREGRDVLAFDVADGEVAAMHDSSLPQSTYEPVPFRERRAVTGGAIGVSLSGFALSLLARTGRAARRRWRRRRTAGDQDAVESPTGETPHAVEEASEREGSA